jgi:surface antigen
MHLLTQRTLLACAGALFIGATPILVSAAPPAHAPAHGWRAKNDPSYPGYTGHRWERDYGVLGGRCDRRNVAAVLGGVVGGAVGSQIGDGSGRVIAILAGTVIGAMIGSEIGSRIDRADEACIAHSLELARDGQPVRWDGNGGLRYTLTPLGPHRDQANCRVFSLDVDGAARNAKRGVGCRQGDGTWSLRGL